jgi:hypothetical protein
MVAEARPEPEGPPPVKTLLNKNLFTKNVLSNKLFTRWLPVITQTPARKMALAAAGLAVTGSAIAGPALAVGSDSHMAPAAGRPAAASHTIAPAPGHPAQAALAAPAKKVDPTQAAKAQAAKEAAMPRDKEVKVDYQPQTTFYYCGPAATRIVASAQGHDLSQDDVAAKLGTTVDGTPSAVDTTRVLNSIVGSNTYHTTSIPDATPTQAQTDKLQADVMRSVNDGRAVVANIAGATTDVTGATHEFDGGHYVAVVGYHDQGGTVKISDPADENGADSYWISTSNLAHWTATHGYSS